MAMTETAQDPGRAGRRRPFTTWVKKLAHFKGGASGAGAQKRLSQIKIAPKKHASKNNNPYPLSGRLGVINDPNRFAGGIDGDGDGTSTTTTSNGGRGSSYFLSSAGVNVDIDAEADVDDADSQLPTSSAASASSEDGRAPPTVGALSVAPTVSTDRDAPRSLLAPSGAASTVTGTTSRTINGASSRRGGGDSTFSSPAPSVRSLTTTLTTIQSLAPGGVLNGNGNGNGGGAANTPTIVASGVSFTAVHPNNNHHHHHHGSQTNGTQTVQFHQPFPSTPASAIPSHVAALSGTAGPGHPATYTAATANNLLTDNASILTLASSSKRRRRRSFDTDASVRALAPSSLFDGSRESLPLSVLSNNFDSAAAAAAAAAASGVPGYALHTTASRMSIASASMGSAAAAVSASNAAAAAVAAERSSIYSATGVVGVGVGNTADRSSLYTWQSLGGGGGNGGGNGIGGNTVAGDAASVRSGRSGGSGLLGHGRAESATGSVRGSLVGSPLVGPRETAAVEVGGEAGRA